jgi:hypothetical protein
MTHLDEASAIFMTDVSFGIFPWTGGGRQGTDVPG